MRKRTWCFVIVLSLFLMLFVASSSWAQAPTQLIVVRASNNTIWKMTCANLTCSGWTQISGMFALQPTLTYDQDLEAYVLIGVSAGNTIWRSTFDIWGDHNNDWVQLSGSTPSPVSVAGGPAVKAWARMNADGTINSCFLCSTDTFYTKRLGTGRYQVDFYDYKDGIHDRPRSAALDSHSSLVYTGTISMANRVGGDWDSAEVWVGTYDSTGAYADRPFTIIIY